VSCLFGPTGDETGNSRAASRLTEFAAVVVPGTKEEADRKLAGQLIAEIRDLNRHMQIPEDPDVLRDKGVQTIAERALAAATAPARYRRRWARNSTGSWSEAC
jgi:alcohol dehydrogenase class IV